MGLDYPDPDVIRVNDTYYMVSTTMHFFPGCEILRSYDLVRWEHAAYVYERLDSTPGQTLTGGEDAYGCGMWAASLRYHKGRYYVCFAANDTKKTYLYTAKSVDGEWEKHQIDGFYYDCSLLFDEDQVYIVYGNTDIYLTQLKEDLSGPMEGGLHRLVVSEKGNQRLGYEGSHFYKINGRYYLFLIHSLQDRWRRVEACFMSDSLEGEFTGGDVFDADLGYCGQGIAQGGIVDTPDGRWFAILFQDRGAAGRLPMLVPVRWEQDFPVFCGHGQVPDVKSAKDGYLYEPLVAGDRFRYEMKAPASKGCFGLKSMWQFNHEPDLALVHTDAKDGGLYIMTGRISQNLCRAQNVLTQRMLFPGCKGSVTIDAGAIKEGDYAGISAFQGHYAFVAVTRRQGKCYLVMRSRPAFGGFGQGLAADAFGEREWESVPLQDSQARLMVSVDFACMKDEAECWYFTQKEWKRIGITHKLCFKLDHFTGCRFGLFLYATKETGGSAVFRDFVYEKLRDKKGDTEI